MAAKSMDLTKKSAADLDELEKAARAVAGSIWSSKDMARRAVQDLNRVLDEKERRGL